MATVSKARPRVRKTIVEATRYYTSEGRCGHGGEELYFRSVYSTVGEAKEKAGGRRAVKREFVPLDPADRFFLVNDYYAYEEPHNALGLPRKFDGSIEFIDLEDGRDWMTREDGLAQVAALNRKRLNGELDAEVYDTIWFALAGAGQRLPRLFWASTVKVGFVSDITCSHDMPVRLVIPTTAEIELFAGKAVTA